MEQELYSQEQPLEDQRNRWISEFVDQHLARPPNLARLRRRIAGVSPRHKQCEQQSARQEAHYTAGLV